MKRSAPLVRRTPLERGTTPLARSRTPRPRRLKRAPMDVGLRHQVYVRAGGRCDCCGTPLPGDAWDAHHRVTRSRGGKDSLENLLALAHHCHMRWHQRDMAEARQRGLMVNTNADPAAVPVRRGERWYLPTGRTWTLTLDPSETPHV